MEFDRRPGERSPEKNYWRGLTIQDPERVIFRVKMHQSALTILTANHITLLTTNHNADQGPVARSMLSANHWLRRIETCAFLW